MVLAAPALGRALGHQQRCRTSPNPKSSAPTTAEARRREGAVAEDTQTKTPRPVTCSARDLIKTLGFAPTPHNNSDGPDPEPRSTNAGTCTARSCGAAQAYKRDPQTSTSCCFSRHLPFAIHCPSAKHLHRCTHCGPCIIHFKPQCTNENGQYIADLPVGGGYRPGEGAFKGATLTVMCLPPPRVPRRGEGVVGWPPVVLLYYFCCCPFKRPPPLGRTYGNGTLPHNW